MKAAFKVPSLRWSTAMVVAFGFLLAFVGFFAEVFQAPPLPQETAQLIRNPIPQAKLQTLRLLEFTNKNGVFKFENTHTDSALEGPWRMIEPTAMKARRDFFVKVVEAIGEIQVRQVHRADPINLQSFSLEKPLFTLRFIPVTGEPLEIAFGLLNPIDNTTYFYMKDGGWIYQSQALTLPLESVSADELLDARALAFNPDQVEILELTPKGFQLSKVAGQWQNSQGQPMDNRKVDEFLLKLQTLKGHMVLDKLTSEQGQELNQIMQRPQWTLRLGTLQAAETYHVSPPLDRIGDLRIDRSGSSILYREGSLNPVVLGKEQVGILLKRESELK
jgi:hypothetical protein